MLDRMLATELRLQRRRALAGEALRPALWVRRGRRQAPSMRGAAPCPEQPPRLTLQGLPCAAASSLATPVAPRGLAERLTQSAANSLSGSLAERLTRSLAQRLTRSAALSLSGPLAKWPARWARGGHRAQRLPLEPLSQGAERLAKPLSEGAERLAEPSPLARDRR